MASIIKNKDIYDPSQGDPLKTLHDGLDLLDKKLADIGKKVNTFQSELLQVSKTGGGDELKRLAEGIQKLNTETTKYTKVSETRNKIAKQIETAESKLVSLYDAEAQQLAEVRLEIQQRNAQLKQQAKDNKVASDSIAGLNIQLSRLRKEYDTLSKEQRESEAVGGRLLKQIQVLDAETKQLTASTGRFQKNVGNYPGLFNNTTFSLRGLGQELLGAAGIVGGVQLLVEGFRAFTDQVQKNIDVTKQLNASFNIGSREARFYAADILAIADTFDQDYNEVAQAAISVSKQLGIGVGEATDLIEEGFLKGSNNSGEFLDILKEYPAQFAAAGIGADQAFAIINQQVTEGIYSDKGVDAIKEGGLRLRENTKAVREALAPLDESIKKQIEQEVAAGRSFEAIKLVSEALNDASLTADQTQAIIADVFGGAGEDAGLAYLQTLKDIDSNLDNVGVSATEAEQSNLNLSKSWNNFIAGVSDSDGVFQKVFSTFKNLLAGAVNSLTLLIDKLNGGESATSAIGRAIEKLKAQQKAQAEGEVQNNATINQSEAQLASNRAARHQAWLARQRQIQAEQAKQIVNSNKRIAQIDKEIAKIDEQSEADEEAALAEIERTIAKEEELSEFKTELQDFEVARAEELAAKLVEIEKEYNEQRRQVLADTANFAGEQFVNLIASGELSFKEFGKFLVTTALDVIERLILLAIAETTAKEIASKGIAGIATGALLVGVIRGTFAAIKSQVQNFATGTEYVNGPGTETSDSIPANLSKGERVLDAYENKKLLKEGIGNKELADLAILGKYSLGAGSSGILQSINDNQKKLLETAKRGGFPYEKDGYIVIERANGKIEMFKKQNDK